MHRQQETKKAKSKECKEAEVEDMFLKINCFKALIKKAWSGVGLTVGNDGEGIYLLGGYWSIYLDSVWMTKKAKAAIIELTGFIPAAGQAVTFWKSEDNQTEERELLPERYYKPDTCYFKTKYKDTGIRIRDYGRGVAVLQNTNTMENIMLAENIVDMVDNSSREKGEDPVSPPLSENGLEGIYWQNETCTLKCMPVIVQEETKEEFLLKKLEEYDFEEKRKRP